MIKATRLKKLYASMVISGSEGWGDGIPVLWLCQYLHERHGYNIIEVYGGGNGESAATLKLKLKYLLRKCLYPGLYAEEPVAEKLRNIDYQSLSETLIFPLEPVKRSLVNKIIRNITSKTFHHDGFIERPPYVTNWLFQPPSIKKVSEVLVTHHNHASSGQGWASPALRDSESNGLFPPLSELLAPEVSPILRRMDICADVLQLVLLEEFTPSMPVLKSHILGELKALPDRYITVQGRPYDAGTVVPAGSRNFYSGDEYCDWMKGFVALCWEKHKLPIVFTSDYFTLDDIPTIDATLLSLWAKIELSRRAQFSYVMHSGFGMIVCVYRGLKDTKLINASRLALHRGPPALLFPNVSIKNMPEKFTASPPGWVDGHEQWDFDDEDSLIP